MNLPGYDAWKTSPPPSYDEPDPDEGIVILQSAMEYLKPRADADEEDQVTGEFEAYAILESAVRDIERDYQCGYCCAPIRRRKDRFCSRGCARAAELY
jgi:hypothetical protein